MDLTVTREVIAALVDAARAAHPDECCGLLLGKGTIIDRIVPTLNVSAEPHHAFEIDPLALIAAHRSSRTGGAELLGYYHSHPVGRAVPSARDAENSTGDLRIWAIIAAGQVAFWRDSGNGFVEQACRVV